MAEQEQAVGPGIAPGEALLGAMFLMVTSAISSGFTAQVGAAFAFAIVVSILLHIAIQLKRPEGIGLCGLRARELEERVAPGVGILLAVAISLIRRAARRWTVSSSCWVR